MIAGPGSGESDSPTTLNIEDGAKVDAYFYGISGNGSGQYDYTVINMTGGEIVNAAGTGIYHPQIGTLNISGGTIDCCTGVEMRSGTLEVSGGTIKGYGDSETQPFWSQYSPGGNTTSGAAVAIVQHGTGNPINVSISGGTFEGFYPIYEENLQNNDEDTVGKVAASISGGTFTSTATEDYSFSQKNPDGTTATVTYSPSAVYSEDLTGFIMGGSFSGETLDSKYIKSGYVFENGSVNAADPVASIDDSTYATIGDALQSANDGDTIVLLDDVTASITIDGLDITLELNGHTLRNVDTAESKDKVTGDHTIIVNEEASLTVKDSVGTGVVNNLSHGKAAVLNYGTFTLESGKLTRSADVYVAKDDPSNNTYYVFQNQGTAFIKGGEVYGISTNSSLIGNAVDRTDTDGATLTISGGTITQLQMNAVKNDEYGGVLYVTGGTINCEHDQAVQNWNQATITGGALNGNVGTWTYANQSNDVTTDIGEDAVINGVVYSSKYASSMAEADSIKDSTTNITGGTINGDLKTIWGSSFDNVTDDDSIEVSGGKFTQRVEDRFLADGFVLIQNSDGTYGVVSEGDTVTVTFLDSDGKTLGEAVIPKGSAVPENQIPKLPDAPEGYGCYWSHDLTVPFEADAVVTPNMKITDLTVNVEIDGDTATAVIDTPVEYVEAYYVWLYGDERIGYEASQTLADDGRYVLYVEIKDADGVSGAVRYEFEYTAEPELPPFIPFPPEQGGDPVEVNPGQTGGSSSSDGGDDTLKVVACAAAAVIAAILIIVWVSTYRKD